MVSCQIEGRTQILMKNEDLFHRVYKENYPKVISLCLGFVSGDRDRANDLAQDTFIKVWENLSSFRNEASISTWIYRITVNVCLSHKSWKKHLPLKTDLEAEESANVQKKEKQFQAMYRCIETLSPINKSIILLELEQVPQQEIAGIMGISHEALRTRIHRIKSQLSKCVKNG